MDVAIKLFRGHGGFGIKDESFNNILRHYKDSIRSLYRVDTFVKQLLDERTDEDGRGILYSAFEENSSDARTIHEILTHCDTLLRRSVIRAPMGLPEDKLDAVHINPVYEEVGQDGSNDLVPSGVEGSG